MGDLTLDTLVTLEREGWDALCASSGSKFYRATATRGQEPPFRALMASVYARADDGVRLVLYQQTTTTH